MAKATKKEPTRAQVLADYLRGFELNQFASWEELERIVEKPEKCWKGASRIVKEEGLFFKPWPHAEDGEEDKKDVEPEGLRRVPAPPTYVLTKFLLTVEPGRVVSWEEMEEVIGRAPKMYWKGARRALKKKEIFFTVVAGVGLRRSLGIVVNKAVKVELDLSSMSALQRNELWQNAGFSRFVYKWGLERCQEAGMPVGGKAGAAARKEAAERKARGEKVVFPKIDWYALSREWTKAAQEDPELAWVKDRIGSVSRFALGALKQAYANAQRRAREGEKGGKIGWPRFPKRSSRRQGFTLQDQSFRVRSWKTEHGNTRWAIKIGKLGMVPVRNLRGHNQLERLEGARVTRLALEQRAGRWWCSLMYEREEIPEALPETGRVAGVDLGYSITISDGTDAPPTWDTLKPLHNRLLWLRHWNKAMSRRWQKGVPVKEQSRRWWRAKRMVQKLHLQIAHIRRDWVEQVSRDLVNQYDVIVTEGFDIRRFIEEEVGYVKGRRTILDIGWGMLRSAIERKAKESGRMFIQLEKLDATDQTCSKCGARDERVDGLFRCDNCGHEDVRPRNTADLLYRVAMGQPPEGFPSESLGSLTGEVGVNARGASQERFSSGLLRSAEGSGKRGRDSSPSDLQSGGSGDTGAAPISKKARKTKRRPRRKPRANARTANTSEQEDAAE